MAILLCPSEPVATPAHPAVEDVKLPTAIGTVHCTSVEDDPVVG